MASFSFWINQGYYSFISVVNFEQISNYISSVMEDNSFLGNWPTFLLCKIEIFEAQVSRKVFDTVK